MVLTVIAFETVSYSYIFVQAYCNAPVLPGFCNRWRQRISIPKCTISESRVLDFRAHFHWCRCNWTHPNSLLSLVRLCVGLGRISRGPPFPLVWTGNAIWPGLTAYILIASLSRCSPSVCMIQCRSEERIGSIQYLQWCSFESENCVMHYSLCWSACGTISVSVEARHVSSQCYWCLQYHI